MANQDDRVVLLISKLERVCAGAASRQEADEVIRAVLVRNGEARLLEVRSGAPCFLIHATGYLADGAPLWWEETWYRGDMYEFHNRLGPMPGARSVTGALR